MNIFSIEFLIFLVSTILLYFICGFINKSFKKTIIPQWLVILAASLLFYGFNNWIYLLYLLGSCVLVYIATMLFQKNRKVSESQKLKLSIAISTIVLIVGVLAVLKYFNFFVNTINTIFHTSLLTQNFIVPLGISFYTFSLVAYIVDCYKKETKAEINPLKFLLFVSYFPKILQGPISSYDRLKEDGLFDNHSFTDINYLNSLFRISVGLVKKIVIANVIGIYVNSVYANLTDVYGFQLLMTVFLYAIQLYCDFSGFIDISIGVSGLLGINLEENFDAPYLSKSIQEFWRRWHITLGAWLKKYIYIPLGGNRKGIFRWIINTLIVWIISGIWHGANWTFVIWGLYHGVLLVISGLSTQIKKSKGIYNKNQNNTQNIFVNIAKVILTFVLVCFGWVLFRSDNIKEAARYFWHMIKFWHPSGYNVFIDTSLISVKLFFGLSFLFIALLITIYILKSKKNYLSSKINKYDLLTYISKYSFVVISVSYSIYVFFVLKTIGGGESSFIYFDF